MNKIKTGQIWYSASKQAERIVIHASDAETNGKRRVLYVEYWSEEGRFQKEGSCSATHLKYWGKLLDHYADDDLLNRAFSFIIQFRKAGAKLALEHLASVIFNPKENLKVHQASILLDEINGRPFGQKDKY